MCFPYSILVALCIILSFASDFRFDTRHRLLAPLHLLCFLTIITASSTVLCRCILTDSVYKCILFVTDFLYNFLLKRSVICAAFYYRNSKNHRQEYTCNVYVHVCLICNIA